MQKLMRLVVAVMAVLAAVYYSLVTYVVPDHLKKMLPQAEQIAREYINGNVSIGGLSWDGGLSAQVQDIRITDESGGLIALIPKTEVTLKPWRAFSDPAMAVSRIRLSEPQVYLVMDSNEQWNLQHFLKESDSEVTPFYGLLQIEDGLLQVKTPYGSWDLNVAAEVDGGANPDFAVKADVRGQDNHVQVNGTVTTKGVGSIYIKSDMLDLSPYASAAQFYGQVAQAKGRIKDLQLTWSNDGDKVQLSGRGTLDAVQGCFYFKDGAYDFCVDGTVSAAENVIAADDLSVSVNGQKVLVEGEADLNDPENIEGQAVISAPSLQYQDIRADNIRIRLQAAGGVLDITDAQAEYGGGQVHFKGRYDIKEKLLTADADFDNIAQPLKLIQEDVLKMNGHAAVLAKAADDKLKISLAADTFALQWKSLDINKLSFDGEFDGKLLKIEHLGALADKGSLAASGSIDTEGALSVQVRMAEFPIDPFLQVAGYSGKGFCSTGFSLGGTLAAPEFSGIVQLTDVDFMHQKIQEAHGLISMKNNIAELTDFAANMEQGKHIINGKIDLRGQEPVFDLAVETYGVRAEPLLALAYPDFKITGNIDNIVQLKGTAAAPVVSGEVRLTDGSAEGYLMDRVQGRYLYDKNGLVLHDFVINALSSEVTLDGRMDPRQQLDFVMDAKNIPLERMPFMEDDLDIDGYVNAKGHLQGSLTAPYFVGDISSEEIRINGEALSELEGRLESNGKDRNKLNIAFKQPYADASGGYGLFKADLNLNIPQRYMQGNIVTLWGNLGSILRMCKQDYNIDGTVQGKIDINPQGKGSGINIDIWGEDIKIHDLNYYRMKFGGHLKQGILSFDDVKIMEQKDVDDHGVVAVTGQIDFIKKNLAVEVGAVKANPAIATVLMHDPPAISGEADMLIQISGSFDNPSANCSLDITNGSLAGVSIDKLTALLTMHDDNINLEQFIAAKDVYNIKADGVIPVDLFRAQQERRNPNAQMKIRIDLNEARLGILPAMTKMVEWAAGDTYGDILLSGTLEEPLLNGSIKIEDGSIKVKDLHTVIDKIQTFVEFKGNKVLLHNLSAQLGKGSIVADGGYALRTNADDLYRLHLKAAEAELVSDIFSGRINSEMEIIPQKYFDRTRPDKNGLPAVAYRPLIKGGVKLDDVLVNMPTVPEFGEGSSNFGLDVALDLGNDIHLFNKYLYDMWLEGGIHVKGSTLFPVIDGSIKAKKGTVTYLRTPFKIQNASVGWAVPGTFLPTVNLESLARFSRYDIFMRINGPVEAMDLQLVSNPPLSQNTIIRMLTLQRDDAGSSEDVTGEDLQNLMTAGLQMTVLGDVEMLIKQTVGLDQFRIYTGKVRSGIGFESVKDKNQELTQDERNQYNLLVSKYLTDNFMIGYTTSFDGLDRSIFGQYDISRHFNITYSRSYDFSDDVEDWYGVEYKTTF